ncbi:L,D-transpeptidase [Tsukamurella spumae]|uniref:L,D-transpeptidase family protein n=1 Tax=Tsukamurella spumae TaxID=44753 RepID=A0A846X4F0_9ACTN|nr:Ig-like domain-containing protein [Tsukamurella spumae]NKY19971.1 L,D-transpeptidase family protein [Tsukamurella spumae]
MRIRPVVSRRALTVVAATAVTAALVASCTTSANDAMSLPDASQKITDSTPFFDLLRPQITSSARNGAVDVQPGLPVKVTASGGTLTKVVMTNPDGKEVAGKLSEDGRSWSNSEVLGYNKQYKLRAEANGIGGVNVANATFSTQSPNNQTQAYFSTVGEPVVGVGQTVGVKFDEAIKDRVAAQRAITVVTEPPVEGAFYWISPTEVRWRPQNYFKPGTKVSVDVKIYGVDLGNGTFGQKDASTKFTIGEETIATVFDKDKIIRISKGGKVVKTMPTSMGEPNNATPNGIYMIGDHRDQMIMDSSTYGVPVNSANGYRTLVDYATQMSYSGIYVHSAPWSISQQGVSNASHGCLNVSPENALWFLQNTRRGDIVKVSDTIATTLEGNDGLGDWNVPWEVWRAGNAKTG